MCRKRRRWALIWRKKHLFVLQSYSRLNALNTENVNARNPGSKFSFTIIESTVLPASKYCLFGVFKYIFHV